MPKRRLYSEFFYKEADSIVAVYVEGEEVKTDHILYVTAAALEDETNEPTTIALGKLVGGRFETMEESNDIAAGIRYHIERTHVFRSGEKLCWRVEGATLNDKLRGYAEGYYE